MIFHTGKMIGPALDLLLSPEWQIPIPQLQNPKTLVQQILPCKHPMEKDYQVITYQFSSAAIILSGESASTISYKC